MEDQAKLEEEKKKLVNVQNSVLKMHMEQTAAKRKADRAEAEYQNKKRETDRVQQSLGNRPEAELKSEHRYEGHDGLLGGVLDFFVGYKKVTYKRLDDSKGEEWDREYANLKRLQQRDEELKNAAYAYEVEAARLQGQQEDLQRECSLLEKRTRIRAERIRKEQETLENERMKAAESYLSNSKKKLYDQIEAYLSMDSEEGPWQAMWKIMNKQIERATEGYIRLAKEQLRRATKEKLEWIESVRNGRRSDLQEQMQVLNAHSALLKQMKHEMEEQLQ